MVDLRRKAAFPDESIGNGIKGLSPVERGRSGSRFAFTTVQGAVFGTLGNWLTPSDPESSPPGVCLKHTPMLSALVPKVASVSAPMSILQLSGVAILGTYSS